MNELLPYEQQIAGKLAGTLLPGEDQAWAAMRKMLDDDDDDIIIPPPNTGCRPWLGAGLLLMVCMIAIVYKVVHRNDNVVSSKNISPVKENTRNKKDTISRTIQLSARNDTVAKVNSKKNVSNASGKLNGEIKSNIVVSPGHAKTKTGVGAGKRVTKKDVFVLKTELNKSDTANRMDNKEAKANVKTNDNGLIGISKGEKNKSGDKLDKKNVTPGVLPLSNDTISNVIQKQMPTSPPIKNSDSLLPIKTEDIVARPNKISFGAGLALQQLIPVDGQKAVPYNAFGRKGSLADYIPSAYFRIYQKKKFLQIEFRYGAPQYAKDIAYSTKVISHDSTTGITTSAVNHVKKTYYNQLPVSIHYTAIPNLSVGVGVVWNKFQSAVVQQQTVANNGPGGADSIINSKIINTKSDSSFARSYLQFMVEAQYTWKRFSLGARFSQGIQPYITYTSPITGQTQKERNASLQIFLRYELWRSKKNP